MILVCTQGEPTPPRTTRIFVARIPPSVTEAQFRSYFEGFGKLQDAYMPKDHAKQVCVFSGAGCAVCVCVCVCVIAGTDTELVYWGSWVDGGSAARELQSGRASWCLEPGSLDACVHFCTWVFQTDSAPVQTNTCLPRWYTRVQNRLQPAA